MPYYYLKKKPLIHKNNYLQFLVALWWVVMKNTNYESKKNPKNIFLLGLNCAIEEKKTPKISQSNPDVWSNEAQIGLQFIYSNYTIYYYFFGEVNYDK
jgi:hypothetical protein